MITSVDLTGQKIHRLTVIKKTENYINPNGKEFPQWLCQCECGNFTTLSTGDLHSGKVIGCGCSKSIGEYNIAKLLSTNNYSLLYLKCQIFFSTVHINISL